MKNKISQPYLLFNVYVFAAGMFFRDGFLEGGFMMQLFSHKRVGVSKEEKKLAYYHFFEQEMAAIPAEKLQAWEKPSAKPAVPFAEKNLYLAGDDADYCQLGYGVAENGTGFVANETYMPGVAGEMLDWWFPWHSVGSDLRYKIWDPEDHYFARADRADYVCDQGVPVREKTWGVSHYIMEDVGMGPSLLQLNFKRPRDFGYDEKIIGTAKCESLVAAVGVGDCAAAMTHKWYPYKDGVMFCSRFWLGYGEKDGQIVSLLPPGVQVPVEAARALFGHNIKEFTNLAAILPAVYAENKDNF